VRCIQTESHSPGSKSEQLQVMYKIYSDNNNRSFTMG
jgi:hypothetical protein